jgi:hypothetical protein
MSDKAPDPAEEHPGTPEQTQDTETRPTTESEPPTAPTPKKPKAVLVWMGIACLLLGALAAWQAKDSKKWFDPIGKSLTIYRDQSDLMKEWTDRLQAEGGPMCKAIATMLTSENLPDLLKARGINNFDDLAIALTDASPGSLVAVCEKELSGQLNIISWVLALAGIGLILLDVLREQGMLGTKSK